MITLALDEVGYNNALIGEYYHIEGIGRGRAREREREGEKKAVIDRPGDGCLTTNSTNCNAVGSD